MPYSDIHVSSWLKKNEKNKEIIFNLKAEKENLFTVIDELKIKIQKYQEEINLANEKVEEIKSVNSELQSTIEKLQNEIKK